MQLPHRTLSRVGMFVSAVKGQKVECLQNAVLTVYMAILGTAVNLFGQRLKVNMEQEMRLDEQ